MKINQISVYRMAIVHIISLKQSIMIYIYIYSITNKQPLKIIFMKQF